MSHPFFHQHSHPPGKLDRLISDNAHTLKLVHICTLHTLHVLLYITFHNSTYLEDKNYNMSTKDLNTKLVLCYLPRIVNCQEISYRGERILFFGPNTNTNISRNQNFDRIRIIFIFSDERIRIRIIFVHKCLAEYEYE